jgi:HlyD family secretion protein
VTEIGNSAIQAPTGSSAGSQSAIDFEVVITLDETPVLLRPDLSATADVVTESRKDAVSIPIIALTVRDPELEETAPGETPPPSPDGEAREVEGVFVVRDGTVRFTPVEVGITGEEHFEVLGGVEVGDTVVAGPYQAVRNLTTGDAVRRMEDQPTSRRPTTGG